MATQATMPQVYTAIAAVQGELAKTGISKDRRNSQQGYNFRGIDDVYSALAPLLAKHGLCVIPRCLDRECVEGQTRKGDPLFRVTVKAEFDFVSSADGSVHTAATFGEAMDSADKATNKAMSAAYKYAAFMTFAIPTEGDDNDADAHTPDVAPANGKATASRGLITDEQRKEIMALAVPKGIDARAICERAGVASIKEMPADVFDAAKAWVIRQKPRAAAQEPASHVSDVLEDEIPY